ncbi:MAG: MBL fold metallo-hydrolase, partial [candidate division Zixibacteria bacterium]|nr:MBL fold metallo-hydrolase [candidate division Zixibacteria bacterium]
SAVKGTPFVIEGPGEYDRKGVSMIGVHSWHDAKGGQERGANTIFVYEMDGLRIAHLGDLGHKLDDDHLEQMGPIDIVMVPVGGVYTLNPKEAAEVVRQIDPWVVIPMHYQTADLKLDSKLAEVGDFLKEMGKENIERVARYSITADKLPADLQVVVLERK